MICHLIEVEKNASAMIEEASIEADKRVSSARAKANTEYKEKYDLEIQKLEENYKQKITEISENHKKELEDYKSSLESKPQDSKSFSTTLEKLLFA